MSLDLASLETIRVAVEPAGSYGVDIALGSSFQALPATEDFAKPSPDREMMDPNIMQSFIASTSIKVPGKRMGTMKIDMTLGGDGLDHDGDVAHPAIGAWPLRALLQTVLGGCSTPTLLGSQITVQALSTASSVVLSAGAGATLTPGMALGFLVSGVMQVGVIESISTDTVTLKQALSGIPSGVVRTFACFYLTQNPDTSLQFELLGAGLNDHWRASGMQAKSFALEAKPGMLPKVSFDLAGPGLVALSAHTGLTETTHANYSPIIASGGCVTIPNFGATTRIDPLVSDFAMTFAVAFEPVTTYCGKDNIARMRLQRPAQGKAAKGSFTVPFEDTSWATARDAKTLKAIHFQVGSEVGATALIEFPRVQITAAKRANSGTNLAGWTVEWEALQDATNATTDLGRASFRIHI